jgi:hypothetical protein
MKKYGRNIMTYYRLAFQERHTSTWIWKSTILTSLEGVFQLLRIYSALPAERIRVFTAASKEELAELLNRENNDLTSGSLTAAQFLRDRGLHAQGASAHETGEETVRRSTSVAIESSLREHHLTSHSAGASSISLLDQKRLQIEQGPGGDHDTPYRFSLPISSPQLLAWTRLLVRVQAGDLRP